jgi:signal transduction histidine kinase
LSDTGVGIPADRIESIFDPFVQINTRLARTEEGIGLALGNGGPVLALTGLISPLAA